MRLYQKDELLNQLVLYKTNQIKFKYTNQILTKTMQFISDRQSLASSFAFQTQNSSSYLLSSRASRRKVVYEQSLDPAQEQIEDFKQEIQQKFKQSIANKIYTFPFRDCRLDVFDDQEYKGLEGEVEVCLYTEEEQNEDNCNRNMFKIMNKKPKNPKVNAILAHLKSVRQNVMSLTLYHEESLCDSNQTTKPTTNNVSVRKSKGKSERPELKSGRTKITYETLKSQEESPNVKRQHLHTEPYEKPMGYILKKK